MNRANPVFFVHALADEMYLVASWGWHRRYLAQELPDRWEIVAREQLAARKAACSEAGYRLIHPLHTRRDAIYAQILAAQKPPPMTPKQRAKYEARQQRKREQEQAEAELRQRLAGQWDSFRQAFTGLGRDEIRRTYRRLARIHHPDAGGSPESFRLLEAAYREAVNR
ncbi:MAG TPA: hypothetical protein V6D23_14730 [Candidatus Obscuribacterales bacterium]